MTKAKQYVLLRLKGMGEREAARRVGFAGGKASPGARKLYRDTAALRGKAKAAQWIRRKRSELRGQLDELDDLAKAIELLEEE